MKAVRVSVDGSTIVHGHLFDAGNVLPGSVQAGLGPWQWRNKNYPNTIVHGRVICSPAIKVNVVSQLNGTRISKPPYCA